ncbi:DUF2461 domain-containing protein [Acidobacteriota bacterium]
MSDDLTFAGFSKETLSFYRQLKRNNNKAWFDRHKGEYEQYVLEPAKAFVVALGEKIRESIPGIIAEPKINKSIFRIYRDTRFSPDKTPYKTHLALLLWEGGLKRMECPSFYIHLEPTKLFLGMGIYIFSSKMISRFRKAVVDPEFGAQLSDIIHKINRAEGFQVGEKHYKRVPSGFDAQHPNADLLLYRGLHVWQETSLPDDIYSEKLVQYCWEKYRPYLPLHQWLLSLISREF